MNKAIYFEPYSLHCGGETELSLNPRKELLSEHKKRCYVHSHVKREHDCSMLFGYMVQEKIREWRDNSTKHDVLSQFFFPGIILLKVVRNSTS